MDSKIAHYNDLFGLGLKLSNLLLIKTIDRELKFFNRDGLHLNKRKGCVALAGIIFSSLFSILRPSYRKAAGRPGPSSRPLHGHLKWGMGVGLGLSLNFAIEMRRGSKTVELLQLSNRVQVQPNRLFLLVWS